MTKTLLPATWLIILIAGLPQLSETVYTPSLPNIAHDLKTSEAMVEYTLAIYLLGFSIGTLFWGKISDVFGRKPCVIAGLIIFIIGCFGCYFSQSIEMLLISRFIQAMGGSIGSILAQVICRDAFHGPALSIVYSSVGSALAIFPAIGPVCGALIAETFGWTNIFIFLICFTASLLILVVKKLPETFVKEHHQHLSMYNIAKCLVNDKKVIGFGLIVASCNGILFSYFAEGSFYLINGLGLSANMYGISFIAIALAVFVGGIISRKLHAYYSSKKIMRLGILIITLSALVLSVVVLIHLYIMPIPNDLIILITILSQMSIALGICIATSNALALSLVSYKHAIGVASSLFGFFYYSLISVFTFGMGILHNGTLLPMPVYFLTLSCFMILIDRICLKNKND